MMGKDLKSIASVLKGIIIIFFAGLYVLSPVDLIPDIVPVLGWADDVAAVLIAGNQLLK